MQVQNAHQINFNKFKWMKIILGEGKQQNWTKKKQQFE